MNKFALTILLIILPLLTQQTCNIPKCEVCSTDPEDHDTCSQCIDGYIYNREFHRCQYIEDQCPIGQYYNYEDEECQDCHPSCRTCMIFGRPFCLDCSRGHSQKIVYDFDTHYCRTCIVNFCLKCDYHGRCFECEEGYSLNDQNECVQCTAQNCIQCDTTDPDTCITCDDSHEINISGSCDPKTCDLNKYGEGCNSDCHEKCRHCFGPDIGDCYDCISGYYHEGTECLQCSDNCKECLEYDNLCTECKDGYVLAGHVCVQGDCPKGYYFDDEAGKCKDCFWKCTACSDYETCTECDNIYYVLNPSQNTCDNPCQSGNTRAIALGSEYAAYLFGEVTSASQLTALDCYACNNCSECYQYSAQYLDCLDCNSGVLLDQGVCVDSCGDGRYSLTNPDSPFGTECMTCPFPCATCDADECFTCNESDDIIFENGACHIEGIDQYQCEPPFLSARLNYQSELCVEQCPTGLERVEYTCKCQPSCPNCVFDLNTAVCPYCGVEQIPFSDGGHCTNKCSNDQVVVGYAQNPFIEDYPPLFLCQAECPDVIPYFYYVANQIVCFSCELDGQVIVNNKYCIDENTCATGYLDVNDLENSDGTFDTVQEFCKPCSSSACKNCLPDNQENCISCEDNEYLSPVFDEQGLKTHNTCVGSCGQGLVPNENSMTCVGCTIDCIECIPQAFLILGQYENLGQCANQCPNDSVQHETEKICYLKNNMIITVEQETGQPATTYTSGEKTHIIPDNNIVIKIEIELHNFYQHLGVGSLECSYTKQGESPIPLTIDETVETFEREYHTSLSSEHLTIGTLGQIDCTSQLKNGAQNIGTPLEGLMDVSVWPQYEGTFTISPETVTSGEGQVQIDFSNWSADTLNLQFAYKLAFVQNQSRQEFFVVDEDTNSDIYQLTPPITQTQQIQSPISGVQTFVTVELTVIHEFIGEQVFTKQLTVMPNDQVEPETQIIDQMKEIAQNPNKNLNSMNLVYSNLAGISAQNLQNLTEQQKKTIAMEKMLVNVPFSTQKIQCNPETDCSSNGQCKKTITSYFNKCNCSGGFNGENCQWKNDDLNYLQQSVASDIQHLLLVSGNSLTTEEDINLVVQTLKQTTNVRDGFDPNGQVVDQVVQILGQLSNNQYVEPEDVMEVTSNFIDIFRKGSDETKQLERRGLVQNIIQKSFDGLSRKLNNDQQTIEINENNIQGTVELLQSLSSVVIDKELFYVSFPQITFTNQDQIGQAYLEAINLPNDFYKPSNTALKSNGSQILNSSVLKYSIKLISTDSTQSNTQFSSYTKGIGTYDFTLQTLVTKQQLSGLKMTQPECMYFNGQEWSNQGVQTIYSDITYEYTCKSEHLTDFTLIVKNKLPPKKIVIEEIDENQMELFSWLNMGIILVLGHIPFIFYPMNPKNSKESKYMDNDEDQENDEEQQYDEENQYNTKTSKKKQSRKALQKLKEEEDDSDEEEESDEDSDDEEQQNKNKKIAKSTPMPKANKNPLKESNNQKRMQSTSQLVVKSNKKKKKVVVEESESSSSSDEDEDSSEESSSDEQQQQKKKKQTPSKKPVANKKKAQQQKKKKQVESSSSDEESSSDDDEDSDEEEQKQQTKKSKKKTPQPPTKKQQQKKKKKQVESSSSEEDEDSSDEDQSSEEEQPKKKTKKTPQPPKKQQQKKNKKKQVESSSEEEESSEEEDEENSEEQQQKKKKSKKGKGSGTGGGEGGSSEESEESEEEEQQTKKKSKKDKKKKKSKGKKEKKESEQILDDAQQQQKITDNGQSEQKEQVKIQIQQEQDQDQENNSDKTKQIESVQADSQILGSVSKNEQKHLNTQNGEQQQQDVFFNNEVQQDERLDTNLESQRMDTDMPLDSNVRLDKPSKKKIAFKKQKKSTPKEQQPKKTKQKQRKVQFGEDEEEFDYDDFEKITTLHGFQALFADQEKVTRSIRFWHQCVLVTLYQAIFMLFIKSYYDESKAEDDDSGMKPIVGLIISVCIYWPVSYIYPIFVKAFSSLCLQRSGLLKYIILLLGFAINNIVIILMAYEMNDDSSTAFIAFTFGAVIADQGIIDFVLLNVAQSANIEGFKKLYRFKQLASI